MNGVSSQEKQDQLIKLTGLYYKIKTKSLERYHNIAEHNESLLFDWQNQLEQAKNLGGEYPTKPFIEPFEFTEDDYDIKEVAFRITLKDILLYKENKDGVTELTTVEGNTFSIKEKVEEIDKYFE